MTFDLHSWPTPNGQKIIIALEEVGANYRYNPIDISKGEQHSPEFRALSPDGKIPALVTNTKPPIVHFESGAILMYLAGIFPEIDGKTVEERARVMSWTFWQVGQLGPMAGQFGRFSGADPANPAAVEHFTLIVTRCLEVMEKQLSASTFLAGESFTVADIASLPWIASDVSYLQTYEFDWRGKYPAVARWVDTLMEKPSVQKALKQ